MREELLAMVLPDQANSANIRDLINGLTDDEARRLLDRINATNERHENTPKEKILILDLNRVTGGFQMNLSLGITVFTTA